MVGHALSQVTHLLDVEEGHGKPKQFDEEVAYEGEVDAHTDVQQQPAAYEIDDGTAECEHQLAKQYEPHKTDVTVPDSHIHDGLGEKGQSQVYAYACGKSQGYLSEVTPVMQHIAEQEAEGACLALAGCQSCLLAIEVWTGL